ncbi:MAG TPA: alginate lyase family protein [Terriglobales bacterium]|nr:alginate lyase family protein [Terriglobales bacterium]
MSLAWLEKWSRIKRLTWDEAQTRSRQELGKRLDAALPRSTFRPERIKIVEARAPGNFFFSQTDIPERVRLLRAHLPAEADGIVGEADEICRHRFRLLGYVDLDYGAEIDWHLDAAHGKHSPLKPWHKINFFDFAQIGDHKVIWELNRHQHLITLAKAWLLTHEARYSNELISQWYSWRRANPYPLGINWASALEVAFRSLSWIWIDQLLAECRELSSQFKSDIVRGLALNGRYVERYLSTYFSPNTHLLGEAAALFFIGVLYPQIPSSDRWKKRGLEILLKQSATQVHPDGVYFEQSLYYHVYALDLFLHARLLASRNEIEVSVKFDEVLKKMLTVVKSLSQSGPPLGFGDDDGGRLFNPRRNRDRHMTDPLALGAVLFQNEQLQAAATLTEESIWLFGAQAASFLSVNCLPLPPRAQSFPDSGIYISAGPEDSSQQIVIDAGLLGAMRAGHGHADALSVKYSADGRPCLVDCGTFCYIGPGDVRNSYRGTAAHNTLRVDELDQAVPDGPFAWKNLPAVRADAWIAGETFTYFSGSHTGFLRLSDPVLHRRFVFHLFNSFWMVRDVAEANAAHILEIFWHFDPSLVIHQFDSSFVAGNPADEKLTKGIAYIPVKDGEWDCQVKPGQVSPIYGTAEPGKILHCRAEIRLPAEHALVVRPLTAKADVPGQLVRVKATSAEANGISVYEFTEHGRAHFLIFQKQGATVWNFGDWESDGEFLYYCADGQRISQMAACNASVIKYRGEALIPASRRVERYEYWERDGKRQAASSDKELLRTFSDTTLAGWDAGVVG